MEMQTKITVRGDRLSDLPEPLLVDILSRLPEGKQVVRTSLLSTRWRYLWMSVPVALDYDFPVVSDSSEKDTLNYLASIHRELHYWRSCKKIRRFRVWCLHYHERFAKDVDLWVHFATKVSNVEDFVLGLYIDYYRYEFPQFAYTNGSLRKLGLWQCQLNPLGSVNWSNLVSLTIGYMEFTDGVMEKILSGCPNLECLQLDNVSGIHRLEISNVKLKNLYMEDYGDKDHELEIFAPYIQRLCLTGLWSEIRVRERNVASLVTVILGLDLDFENEEDNLEKELRCFKELLHNFAHIENLELGPWCIKCLSILELQGWKFPPSSRKTLYLSVALEQLDFSGVCIFLQSSLDLESLVIEWYDNRPKELLPKYTNDDEQTRRFEAHNFDGSFPHLKRIKILNFSGSVLPLVKYLLKHATVLEKFVIDATFEESADESPDYAKMEQEFLSFPRSSPHVSVTFSY